MTLCALLLLSLLPFLLGGRHAPEGTVTAYDALLTVRKDGSIRVRETFTFDYLGTQRGGLVRSIRQRDGDLVYEITGLAVSSETGAPVHLQVEDYMHEKHIVIGDDTPVSGRHTYELGYELRGVLTPREGRDEFVWDLLRPGWPVRVEEVSVRIEGPSDFSSGCLAGGHRDATPCAGRRTGPFSVEYRQSGLRAYEAVKVRAAFPSGVLDLDPPHRAPPHASFTPWGWMALLLAFPLALVARYRTPPVLRRALLSAGAGIALWDVFAETVPGGFGRLSVGDPLLGGLGLLILGALAARPPVLRRG